MIFIIPTIFLFLIFMTLTILPWYTGIILATAEFFGMHHVGDLTNCFRFELIGFADRYTGFA